MNTNFYMDLDDLRNKNIHIVGITGSEGSAILSFLLKHKITTITGHDFIEEKNLENNFKLWHKGISLIEKEKLWQTFQKKIVNVPVHFGSNYLTGIEKADVIFVPQSWRLYKENDAIKISAKNKTPLYSLTRLYLEFAPGKVIGITGTVGKGSTAAILTYLLEKGLPAGRHVYFGGNDTWMIQVLDRLDEMKKDDILVLEISHRQLLDGLSKSPAIAIFTNLHPNHLDEMSWEDYKNVKMSLVKFQHQEDIAILNYDIPELQVLTNSSKAKKVYYSWREKTLNTPNIQKIYDDLNGQKKAHYEYNLLAALTAADTLGIPLERISANLSSIPTLPARLEYVGDKSSIKFYNDIKSTSPWATLAAVDKLGRNTILICGGDTKGIDYQIFVQKIKENLRYIIILKSNLSDTLSKILPNTSFHIENNLEEAISTAYQKGQKGDNILISGAAAFFYTKFIAQKESVRKIITSLPPKEKA